MNDKHQNICPYGDKESGRRKRKMPENKTTLQVNKYADLFLMAEVKNFEGAAHKAYADMARRTLRIKENSKERIALKKSATEILRQAVEDLKNDSSDFPKWHEKSCNALIACYGGQLSYGQAQKWLNMLLKYLYVYDVNGYETLFSSREGIAALDMPVDSKVIEALHRKYTVKPPTAGWSVWDRNTYRAYQAAARSALHNAPDIENPDERLPFYWELIHWSDASAT